MPLSNETVALLLESLREHGSYVFATPEDSDFFRKCEGRLKQDSPRIKKEEPPKGLSQNKMKYLDPTRQNPIEALRPEREGSSPRGKGDEEDRLDKVAASPNALDDSWTAPKPNLHFLSVRNVLSVIAPELAILNEIPSDTTARKIAQRWKTKNQSAPISILLLQEPPEQRALLEQIAKALEVYFGPTKVVHAEGIEKEKQWEAFLSVAELKWVIACDYTLWQLNGLMQFYKETPAQGTRTLGNVPLFLLPDLSLYLKDPLLKRSLWKALCQKCS